MAVIIVREAEYEKSDESMWCKFKDNRHRLKEYDITWLKNMRPDKKTTIITLEGKGIKRGRIEYGRGKIHLFIELKGFAKFFRKKIEEELDKMIELMVR